MSDGFGQFVFTAIVAVYTGQYWLLASSFLNTAAGLEAERSARRRAIQQQNDAARDRLDMQDLAPDSPRTLVMGRVRYVEGVRRYWTSGTNDEKLTLIVSFAGHEIDGFEQWYLNDDLVTLDADGWVIEAPWRKYEDKPHVVTGTLDGSGAVTLALAGTPPVGAAGSAIWSDGSGDNRQEGAATLVFSGATAVVSGGRAGAPVTVTYPLTVQSKHVRIRSYVGTAAQNVGAALASEYPGKITSADRFAGIALAVMDVMYEPDIFPQGRPNLSAVMRGAKLLDPRTGTTVFSQNLALQCYHYFTYARGWARSAALARTTDVIAAANDCDVSTAFTLRKPDGSTSTVTRPRYHGGITIPDDADKDAAMAALVQAMNGSSGWTGLDWRLRAGALASTVATITQDWLVNNTRGGQPDDEPVITAVQTVKRTDRINRVAGKCTDPDQRWQLLPFPAVQDPVLVAAKGERLQEVEWQAVNHIAHAQHLASMAIRRAQAGLQLELTCGEQAADLELLDVVALNMADYGYSGKLFEVVGTTWSQTGAYKVLLAETSAALYTVDAELTGRDPAPDGDLRPPWDVEGISITSITSGTAATLDNSVITRTTVNFSPAVGQNVRQGGQIEVQYTEAAATLPVGEWPSQMEPGSAVKSVIPSLLQGRFYAFRTRAVQPPPTRVRGPWSALVLHKVASRRSPKRFRATTAPTGDVQDGDEWIDTDDGNKRYTREAGGWVAVPLGTGGIAPGAATEVITSNVDHAGATFGTVVAQTFTHTPAVDSVVEFTAKVTASNILGDSGNTLSWYVTPAGGADVRLGGSQTNGTAKQEFTAANAFSAAAGVLLTFELRINRPGGNPAIGLFESYMRATVIKR